jgi:hypothetical protein
MSAKEQEQENADSEAPPQSRFASQPGIVHSGSSEQWGDLAGVRLLQMVMSRNTGAAQQVSQGKTELLDLLSDEDIKEPDDLGITLQFLTVYYDQPDVLRYLWKRGISMEEFCDPMKFGTPAFYAVFFRKHRMLKALFGCGVDLKKPCDALEQTPMHHAQV